MPETIIDFYFDVISPYAWFGFEGLLRYEEKLKEQNVKIQLKPYVLGGILKSSGNRPPILLPAKAQYMPNDLKMLSKYWGFNITLNPNFATEVIPNGTILPQRFLTALEKHKPEYLISAAREFWKRIWETHQPIHEEQHLIEIAKSIGLPNVERYIELTKSTEIKDILKNRTTEAVETGAFGAPWFVIRKSGEPNRCFWGSDRLPIVLNECGVNFIGPLKSKI